MGIETPHYDAGNDLSAAEYRLTLDLARTLHGRRRIADDPLVAQRLFNSEAGAGRVIAHRVNTLAKLDDAGRAGFDGVEVDLLFRDSAGGYFELGHDEVSRTGGELEAFLDAAARWRFSKVWLDIKNLDSDNYRQALQELERLAVRHPWVRDIAIVESSARDAWFARFAERGWHTSYYLPTEEILGAMRAPDPAARERLAGSIARQVNEQGTAAISYDVRLHAFVQRHLQRRLDPHVVYHVWDLSVLASEPGAWRRLEAADYYRDERIRTIIVAIQSAYSI
jgi:hypothetical protein